MHSPFVSEASIDLVRQVVDHYLPKGFFHFAAAKVKEGEPFEDQQILDQIQAAKWASRGRWTEDLIGYMRCGPVYYLFSQDPNHPVFQRLIGIKGDIRLHPCVFWEYEIRTVQSRGGKFRAVVRIENFFFECLWIKVFYHGAKYGPEELTKLFKPYLTIPFSPVRQQLLKLLRVANEKRKEAGLEPVPQSVVGLGKERVKKLAPNQ